MCPLDGTRNMYVCLYVCNMYVNMMYVICTYGSSRRWPACRDGEFWPLFYIVAINFIFGSPKIFWKCLCKILGFRTFRAFSIFPLQKLTFSIRRRVLPHPLTDISAKNVRFFGRLPLVVATYLNKIRSHNLKLGSLRILQCYHGTLATGGVMSHTYNVKN